MSCQLINRSADLRRLRDEGYDLQVKGGLLLVRDVPYVNAKKEVKRGTLVSTLTLAGDVTAQPENHVAHFIGELPCNSNGAPLVKIIHSSASNALAEGVVVQHMFSAKPLPSGFYMDYYSKVTTYVAKLSAPAQVIDPTVTAKTFPVIEPEEEDKEAVFNYLDTASSRAEINLVTDKLKLARVAIVGVGGTGSYVLDLVAKTPVREIHLFDGDTLLQHNAFRAPGAPSVEDLREKPKKTSYLKAIYSKMHRGIVDHGDYLEGEDIEALRTMSFVFLCLDSGPEKKAVVEHLEDFDLPFIDVGMGLYLSEGSLAGVLRVTTSTSGRRDCLRQRVSFADEAGANEYDRNIQIAELNALNAALAVIRWKKLLGFYHDLKGELDSTYTIAGNLLLSAELIGSHE